MAVLIGFLLGFGFFGIIINLVILSTVGVLASGQFVHMMLSIFALAVGITLTWGQAG